MESIFQYFDYESRLKSLAKKLANFNQINERYLNRRILEDDIYRALKDIFISRKYFDWDDLADDPELVEEMIEDRIRNLSGTLYSLLILGIKGDEYGHNKTLDIYHKNAEGEIKKIAELIAETFRDLVEDYRELIEDKYISKI